MQTTAGAKTWVVQSCRYNCRSILLKSVLDLFNMLSGREQVGVAKMIGAEGTASCHETSQGLRCKRSAVKCTWKLSEVRAAQVCPTLYGPTDYTVHGILQARILEWAAFPLSRGSSQPRDRTQASRIAGRLFTSWATGSCGNTATKKQKKSSNKNKKNCISKKVEFTKMTHYWS